MAGPAPRIRVLVDNLARESGHLAQHGFSALCEMGPSRILFDTGATGEVLLRNARAMGIDLGTITDIVLSHGHADHGGGLVDAMDACPTARVWIPHGALLPRWSRRGGEARDIALPHPVRERLVMDRRRWTEVGRPARIADGIWLTGPVPGERPRWACAGLFRNSLLDVPDDVPEEQALVLETAEGVVVLSGCGHWGVPALLRHLWNFLPGAKIALLAGGLHLEGAPEAAIDAIASALREAGTERVAPCHCSGPDAASRLTARGLRCATGRVGAELLDAV